MKMASNLRKTALARQAGAFILLSATASRTTGAEHGRRERRKFRGANRYYNSYSEYDAGEADGDGGHDGAHDEAYAATLGNAFNATFAGVRDDRVRSPSFLATGAQQYGGDRPEQGVYGATAAIMTSADRAPGSQLYVTTLGNAFDATSDDGGRREEDGGRRTFSFRGSAKEKGDEPSHSPSAGFAQLDKKVRVQAWGLGDGDLRVEYL